VDDFKTLRAREITHKCNTGWEVDTVKVVDKSDGVREVNSLSPRSSHPLP
jgi:hypothetical protein